MKYLGLRLLFALWLLFLFSTQSVAADTYILDNKHTYVLWHASHFGFSNPSGKWLANGTLVLDQAKPQNSKLNVIIQMAELSTGIPDFDKHLKGQLFLDVVKFPKATFISDKIDITGKDTAKVHGTLTLHGISKPLTLNVRLNKMGMSPVSNKETVGFTASTTLKRSEFGIATLLPGVSDDVKIDIEVEAYKAS